MPAKSLADLVQDRLGVKTFARFNPVKTTAGVTAAQVLRQQPNRAAFVYVNLSTADIYLGPFADVSATKGIRIPASGGSAVFLYEEDFDLVGYEWFDVATVAASAIFVLELLTQGEP